MQGSPQVIATAFSLAIVYPGPVREGLSSLAVWRLEELARRAGVRRVERFYVEGGRLTTERPAAWRPRNFRLWAISIPCEEQWTAVPWLLEKAGITPRAEKRSPGEPLVVLGGFSLSLNPRPLAAFADAIVTGDAEPVFADICSLAAAAGPRSETLQAFSALPGVWVPQRTDEPPPAVFYQGDEPAVQPAAAAGVFSRMLLVETGRGCPARCRFCAISHLRRPHFFSAAEICYRLSAVGAPPLAAGLVGASFSWHPQLKPLELRLGRARLDLGLASLDVRRLASPAGEELLRMLERSGLRTATLAPEAGCERLRQEVGKPLSEEQLECAVRRLLEHGVMNLKLYVMYGLPGEAEDDLGAIAEMCRRVRGWMNEAHRKKGKTGRLTVSANPLVPKPHTPWSGLQMPPLGELQRRLFLLKRLVGRQGGVILSGMSPRAARLQWLLDLAGAEAAETLQPQAGKPPRAASLAEELKKMLERGRDIG